MEETLKHIRDTFGHRLRLRVSGICLDGERILLVKHLSIGKKGILWAPPGGGLEFHETVMETLVREFKEETGLEIRQGALLMVNEYRELPLHAIELFFKVELTGGELITGTDPELPAGHQLIKEVRFVPFEEISQSDPELYHSLFRTYKCVKDFTAFTGFLQNIVG